MLSTSSIRREWFGNIRADVLSGIVVALALIPEAIGFSVIAGVDPKVGLYASVVIACVIAFTGGRPAMISAATAATAVLMADLVKEHGVQYLFAATILMGVLQILAGLLKLGRLMRFVSQSVMTGFVNALAILIFMAQLPELINVPPATYALIALGLAIIYLLPRITRAIPSPLVAILVLTVITAVFGLEVRTVAHLGELPSTLPVFGLPDVPWTFETLAILLPVAAPLAAVGLLESLLTAQIVDDMTDTPSNKNRECVGQGTANIASAFFGGMSGCAMIGQSVINVSSGARGRLSALTAGIFLLVLLIALQDLLAVVPVAALTAVMIMVSINTFSWRSLARLRANPLPSSAVMLATVATVVATHDLAKGVLVGVLLSGVFFAGKVARLSRVTSVLSPDERTRTYYVEGQIFFATANAFFDAIDLLEPVKAIIIDVSKAHFWDISAVGALDRIVLKARRHGLEVDVIGLNEASATMVERFGTHDKEPTIRPAAPH
ncbi:MULTISPECIES: SulP family inorganic anion transporter [unclassified Chelatococcus]|uniref:SulP family inorganic anion transporter n=1 Tax=unclassified Chelatococcus TaxID=2638111 RepID=UPI001BD0E7F7|nr:MULTISPECIES: SulP family inorganic anion transporter [unclassified Chelatococcus]MBS7695857.1 SulP family inorganic anion transporter [Chelatococcus sp. YT9]MBX3555768.1 SulP family inorganic anion transporter [Chelatococcus sp.]